MRERDLTRGWHLWLLSTACISGVAHAQLPSSPPSTPSAQAGIADIVVTANRREERMQDVPIAVTALSGDAVTKGGITNTETLTTAVPGLVFTRQAQGATPFLRGIGNGSALPGQEPTVAMYVDGIYMGASAAGLFSFNNIERVEVLKGPQGTLFGRNATAGVVQIVTRLPSHDFGMDASAGYGNFDTFSGSIYGTAGLSDNVAIDLSVMATHQGGGWGRNLTNGNDIFKEKAIYIRSKLLFDLSEDTRLILAGDYSDSRNDFGLNWHPLRPGGTYLRGGVGFAGNYNGYSSPSDKVITKQKGASARLEQDLGFARLTSITAYRDVPSDYRQDADGTPTVYTDAFLETGAKTFSQELQLGAQAGSAIQWILGAYYLHDKSTLRVTLRGEDFGPSTVIPGGVQKTDSYSAFGQATGEVLDNLNLTLGLRYSTDKRKYDGSVVIDGATVASDSRKASFSKLTWRGALDYKITPDVLAYLSYNRGFKSGVFNTIAVGTPAVRPEVLDAYEVGLKSDLFDRKVRFNLAAFYYDYKDIQVDSQIRPGVAQLLNAASARVKGIETELTVAPVQGLTLSAGMSVLDSKYKSFDGAPFYIPQPSDIGGSVLAGAGTCPASTPFTGTGCNGAGNALPRAPKFTMNLAFAYHVDTAIGGIDLNASLYHNDGYYWTPDNRPRQGTYDIVNMSLGWQSASSGFYARLWANNLLDKAYTAGMSESGAGDLATPAAPRTYGITIGVKLGSMK